MSSENVDAFAQEYLERARKRREMLVKKLADTSPRRKRNVPLLESQEVNISPPKAVDDDSPNKRQCLREEQTIKPDTPAIPGIKSRLNNLMSERSNWDNAGMIQVETTPASRQKKLSPSHDVAFPSATRKNRLAALAENINSWEDDLHHVTIKKAEPVKKHTWEPSRCDVISKPTKASPPVLEVKQDGSKIISSLTVTLGSTDDNTSNSVMPEQTTESNAQQAGTKSYFSPIKEETRMPSPHKSLFIRDTTTVKNQSPSKSIVNRAPSPTKLLYHRDPSPIKPASTGMVTTKAKRRESFEPSAQPVSARLAGWQERVNQVEDQKMESHNNAASRIHIQSKQISPKKNMADEPTASVHSRMASWEHKTHEEDREQIVSKTAGFVGSAIKHTSKTTQAVSPLKSPPKAASSVISPITSPNKVAPVAKAIHNKLQHLQEGWKNNDIAEKIKQQRQTDLAILENRWKDGMLNEEVHTTETKPKSAAISTMPQLARNIVPAPPPLPPNTSAMNHKSQSPRKHMSPTKPVPITPKTPKVNEGARNKIRAVHQELIEKVMGQLNGAGKSANHDPHFENKLKTLGFEIESKTESGHVATLDLKEQRKKDRLKQETEKRQQKSPKKPSVNITEEIVTSLKFNDSKSTAHLKVKEPRTPVTARSTTTGTPGSSLYSLIRKQTPGGAEVYTHDVSSGTLPLQQKFDDSFSSDETSFEDEPEQRKPTQIVITTHMRRSPSTCSEYSDSQVTTQSDDDEYSDTEYSMDETESTTQSDQSENSMESEEEGGVSDLLEEVMDDTVTEPPVPAPRRRSLSPQYIAHKLPPEAHPGHPDHQPPTPSHQGTSQSRQAVIPHAVTRREGPPKHPRLQHQKEEKRVAFTSPGGSTYRSNSSSSDQSVKVEIVHSIDNYRNMANIKRNAPEPRLKIIRRSEHFDPDETEVNDQLPFIPQECTKQKLRPGVIHPQVHSLLQELHELVNQEQNVIKQTSNALNQCQLSAPLNAIIECHRLLLQACKKREAYLTEMNLLRSGKQPVLSGPKGSLTISDIRLPLKQGFVQCLKNEDMDVAKSVYYFIVLFRQGAHVIFTQMVSTDDKLISDSLDIPNHVANIEIRQDFRIDMEIYSMSIAREVPTTENKTPKKKKGMTPKKGMSSSKKTPLTMQSPGGPSAVRTSKFTLLASLPLTLNMVNKTHFNLAEIPYSSPLYGTVYIKMRCLLEVLVEEKGFLTMFEDVSGLGAWHRRWCVLKHNMLSYWKYPDDTKFKDPIDQIDLKSCISNDIGLISRDLCARPNTFELVTVRRQIRGESDTLVSSCYNTMTTTKHWLSADTKEDRYVWCHKLNEALRNIRAWNPDALRPIKRHLKPVTDTGV